MRNVKQLFAASALARGRVLVPAVVLLLVCLPIAIWLDLRNLSRESLLRQAADVNALISSVRDYYADNVVAHVLAAPGATRVDSNYADIPGAIPIPATLSIELGRVISSQQSAIAYRFVSDYPFKGRSPHALDAFEQNGLATFRRQGGGQASEISGSFFLPRVRLLTPVVMSATCVGCHNSHPDSPKRDWKVGDVRGIQEVTVGGPPIASIFSFKYLLAYFLFASAVGASFIWLQKRQASTIAGMNRELSRANDHLAALSAKISHYLSPQLYQSIFSGERDVLINTERKKLTIFFSDIVNFTAITERLQPEEITLLLNEYLTAMSDIALAHGGTVDRFIGDAMLIFFGDPQTRGTAEDAKSCVLMALAMRDRLRELNTKWRKDGFEEPLCIRTGINTGFCNVGNFGSANRMEYTAMGGEANLAARLQSIASPGDIVLSYETYMLVQDLVVAHALPPMTVKGIARPIVPYVIDSVVDPTGDQAPIVDEHITGLDIHFDPALVEPSALDHVRGVLSDAIGALDRHAPLRSQG